MSVTCLRIPGRPHSFRQHRGAIEQDGITAEATAKSQPGITCVRFSLRRYADQLEDELRIDLVLH